MAWNSKGIRVSRVQGSILQVIFSSKEEKERVMSQGPWCFDPSNGAFDSCGFCIQVRGLQEEFCFQCGRMGHLIRECPLLEPTSDFKLAVVCGLWIKAPMEKSWVEFRSEEYADSSEQVAEVRRDESDVRETGSLVCRSRTLEIRVRKFRSLIWRRLLLLLRVGQSTKGKAIEIHDSGKKAQTMGRGKVTKRVCLRNVFHPYQGASSFSSPSKKISLSCQGLEASSQDLSTVKTVQQPRRSQ
ncbi:hypothetical protein LIER_23002 [Lithospermum erythrorhizon]|uniref:CCHC-type domain-containing protein n=1 Tax=Lithospermum erythrorhizon TaxID=34254 RepID=A0AAV3QYF7_LITER